MSSFLTFVFVILYLMYK